MPRLSSVKRSETHPAMLALEPPLMSGPGLSSLRQTSAGAELSTHCLATQTPSKQTVLAVWSMLAPSLAQETPLVLLELTPVHAGSERLPDRLMTLFQGRGKQSGRILIHKRSLRRKRRGTLFSSQMHVTFGNFLLVLQLSLAGTPAYIPLTLFPFL